MPLYEHVFLARQDMSGQQVEALVDQFKAVIEQNGGSIGKVEAWGLKSISYRIKKNRKAHYTLMNIDAPAAAVAELERQQGISEDILRFLTLRVEAHETEPSAMMQKRDRGDRDDRRGGFGDRFGDRGGFGGGRGRGGFGDRDRDRGPRREGGREEATEGGEE
jgi:small subunit ribosomal protein S6